MTYGYGHTSMKVSGKLTRKKKKKKKKKTKKKKKKKKKTYTYEGCIQFFLQQAKKLKHKQSTKHKTLRNVDR